MTSTVTSWGADAYAIDVQIVLPRLIRFCLVLLPALWGIPCARRASVSRVTLATRAVALIVLTSLAAPFLESSMM